MLVLFGLFVAAFADPQNVQKQFCIYADVEFSDNDGGDYWTDTSAALGAGEVDKPARGFLVEVRKHAAIGAGSTWVWTGWTEEESGAEAGCTEPITLVYDSGNPNANRYLVRVSSGNAKVNGNTLDSFLDPLVALDEAVTDVLVFYVPSGPSTKVYPPALPVGLGPDDDRYNVLATAAFALSRHDGGVDATYTFGNGAGNRAEYIDENNIVWLSTRRRWIYMHELGHAVSEMASGDQNLEPRYGSTQEDCGPPSDSHQMLSKEWQSGAAVEGIATWYAQITFNAVQPGADCGMAYWKDIDWNNDGDIDVENPEALDCFGDPDGPNGVNNYANEVHWLENLIDAPDLGPLGLGCTGPLENKGVEYEWSRYYWAMTTVHGYTVDDMYEVWSAAGPGTWDPNGSTPSTGDDPGFPVAFYASALLDPFQLDPGNEAAVEDHGINP